MSEQIAQLIHILIERAREQGLSQAQLAERAGVSAVGLSKAKHRGDIRASTLAELAAQLNLELALVPRPATPRAAEAAEAIKAGTFLRRSPSTKAG
jgi:transcriptional regulator with XRE-family HTH domain